MTIAGRLDWRNVYKQIITGIMVDKVITQIIIVNSREKLVTNRFWAIWAIETILNWIKDPGLYNWLTAGVHYRKGCVLCWPQRVVLCVDRRGSYRRGVFVTADTAGVFMGLLPQGCFQHRRGVFCLSLKGRRERALARELDSSLM